MIAAMGLACCCMIIVAVIIVSFKDTLFCLDKIEKEIIEPGSKRERMRIQNTSPTITDLVIDITGVTVKHISLYITYPN